MQFYRPGDSYYGEFTTSNFSTGAAADADSLPSATATKNGTDDVSFTLTCAKIDTGRYKITGTIPAYSVGDRVQISVAATVDSVAAKAVVDNFQISAASSGVPILHTDGKALLAGTTHASAVIPTVTDVSTKTGYALTGDYDAAKSAAPASTALSNLTWTNARAAFVDNLNVGGVVASKADIESITQSMRVRIILPSTMTRLNSSSISYRVWIYSYNELHQAEDLDSNPTVTVENNSGTDRSSNLGTVTKPAATTGQYYVDYTVAVAHGLEGLIFKVAATESSVTTNYAASSIVVEEGSGSDLEGNVEDIKAVTDSLVGKIPTSNYLAGSENSDGSIVSGTSVHIGG